MSILADFKMYGRFAWGLPGFLRHTISLEEAKALVQRRLADRETNFLSLVKKGIFGYPKSPYLHLLKLAHCELGDIENMVRTKGLEETLQALRESGVFVTFEEFKGRQTISRSGKMIPVRIHDFDNPYLKHYYEGTSGGTTGVGTRIGMDLDHLAAHAPYHMLIQEAHGVLDAPTAIWFGTLPDTTGLTNIFRRIPFGNIPKKWFSPTTKQDYQSSFKNRLATLYIIFLSRLFGTPIPRPESVPLDQAIVVARWAVETLKTHGKCLVNTHVSKALRVCLAAEQEMLDLTGLTFIGSGEPATLNKVRRITQTGAKIVPSYNFTETGIIGQGCVHPTNANDIHFYKDSMALIQYPRRLRGSEIMVDAFYFTTLLPTVPKLMLNVEIDDYGVIEKRSCGCLLEHCGFTEHLHDIYSFRKLTGEGVTLVGSEMVQILEEVLPAHFGGTPLDYQWLEEEDENGFTRLILLISPKVKISDEKAVIDMVLKRLSRSSVAADLARVTLNQANTLQVRRMEPIWTARGKLLPLHLIRLKTLNNEKNKV